MKNNYLLQISYQHLPKSNAGVGKIKTKFTGYFTALRTLYLELVSVTAEISKVERSKLGKCREAISFCEKCLPELSIQLQFEDALTQKLTHIVEANHRVISLLNAQSSEKSCLREQHTSLYILKKLSQVHLAQLEQIREECKSVDKAIISLLPGIKESLYQLQKEWSKSMAYIQTVRILQHFLNKINSFQENPPLVPVADIEKLIREQKQALKHFHAVSPADRNTLREFMDRIKKGYTVESELIVFDKVMEGMPGASKRESHSFKKNETGSIDFF